MSANAEKSPGVSYCSHFFKIVYLAAWGVGRGAPALERAAVIAGSALSCTGMCDLDSLIGDRAQASRPGRCVLDHRQSPHPALLPPDIFGLLPHPPYARDTSISRLLNEPLPPWKCCSFGYSSNSCSHFLQIFPQISLSL